MTELQHVLDRLRTVSVETWIFGFLLVAIIGLPILQIVIWIVTWSLFTGWPKWKSRIRRGRLRLEDIWQTFRMGQAEGSSPPQSIQIVKHLGHGDLCEVEQASVDGRSYVIKTPRNQVGTSLLAKEREIVEVLHAASQGKTYQRYLPVPVDTIATPTGDAWTYQWREGYFTAEEIMRQYPDGLDGRHIAWMFNRTLEILGFVHRTGWVHGAVLPPHLLYHAENHGLQLIGWTHAEPLGEWLRVAPERFREWYPPECRRREAATEATDVYLAAASMMALAGGDPLSGSMPAHVPIEMQALLKECLAESPLQRPGDAWELRDRFEVLLRGVYGRPKFCRLIMS